MMSLTPEKIALKRVQLRLVESVGGFEASSGFCRIGKSQLHNACSESDAATFLPADVIMDLEPLTANAPEYPVVTRYLARRRGFELFKLPPATCAGQDWATLLAQHGRENGDVVAKIATHLMSGITARQVRDCGLIEEIDEAIAVLVNMRAAAKAAVAEQ